MNQTNCTELLNSLIKSVMELPSSSSASSDFSQQNKPDNNHPALKDWTKEEKYDLIQALKTYGRHDYQKLQEYVITKNLAETKAAVEYFTAIASQHPTVKNAEEREQNDPKPKPSAPSNLTEWTKLLKDNFQDNELRTETATAVRMIADLENIPAPQVTENIDFRQVYHTIADAMEGKPIKPDLATCAVLKHCLTETAKASKVFIKTAAARSIINNLDLSDKRTKMFPQPTENQELAILRHLASQQSHNPLKIPEEHLKSSAPNFEFPSISNVLPSGVLTPEQQETGQNARKGKGKGKGESKGKKKIGI